MSNSFDPSRLGSGGDTSDAGSGIGGAVTPPVPVQNVQGTSGRWADGGGGSWVWIPGTDPANVVPPMPTNPPPSATSSSAGLNASTTTGTSALQSDIAARQATPNPYSGLLDTTSVSAPGPSTTAAQRLAASGVTRPVTAALPTAQPAGAIGTSNIANTGYRGNTGEVVSQATQPGVITAPSKTEQAADAAKQALGPPPTIDMGLADRQLGPYNEALNMSREVLDRLLNSPDVSAQIGAQTLTAQLALARSARGGPGAVQSALDNAQEQAPQLEQQAAIQGSQEQQARLSTAGQVASGFANAALGARGQDIGIAADNQTAATQILQNVAQLTGTQLNIDQQQQNLIGEMARDAAMNNYNYAALDQKTQEQEFDRAVQLYGIDTAAAAQIKAAGIAVHKGPMDYLMGLVGAGATVAAGFATK